MIGQTYQRFMFAKLMNSEPKASMGTAAGPNTKEMKCQRHENVMGNRPWG